MKVKRQKRVQRVLTFYKANFGVTPPYSVLLDGTFCKAALKFKINLSEQLPKYLDAEVSLRTTKCVLEECKALGALLYGPLKVLEQFSIHKCSHKGTLPASRCLYKTAKKNEGKHLFVATQDSELSDRVRLLLGVPLLFISHNAINLEQPSDTSRDEASRVLDTKLTPSQTQISVLHTLKKSVFGEEEEPKKKKRKKIKGPNPLSCKKKQKKRQTSINNTLSSAGEKRGRKRKRHRRATTNIMAS